MFLHTGLQNFVILEEIQAINASVYSAPTKRAIRDAEAANRVVDHTEGRKTRSVLFLKGGNIVLSTLESQTLVKRGRLMLEGKANDDFIGMATAHAAVAGKIGDAEEEVEEEELAEAEEAEVEEVKPAPKAKGKAKAAPAPAPKAKGKAKAKAAPIVSEEEDEEVDLPE